MSTVDSEKLRRQQIVRWWDEHLGKASAVTSSYESTQFRFDCKIKLRGFGRNHVLIVGDAEDPASVARDFIRTSGHGIALIACLSDSTAFSILHCDQIPSNRMVVLPPFHLEQLEHSAAPVETLETFVREAFPFLRLVPYNISSPAFGNMFIGRRHELNELVHLDQDFAICGAGGMGKSSLIEQMIWTLRQQRDPRCARIVRVDLIDCLGSLDAAAKAIATAIYSCSRANDVGLHNLFAYLKHCKGQLARFDDGPIDLVLDETDRILKIDSVCEDESGERYPLMRTLRHARQKGIIRITICGRVETEALLALEDNPFSVNQHKKSSQCNRFRLLKLEPLSGQDSWTLIRAPLQALGVIDRFPVEKIGRRVADCAGIPFQLQDLGLNLCNQAARETL